MHGAEDYFVKGSNQKSVKDGLGGPLGSRVNDVKHYKKSENKWKKDLKALNNQNKYFIALP